MPGLLGFHSIEVARSMTPDPSWPGGGALRLYQGYRYTIVTIANGAKPHPIEAALWYAARG